ncbi:VOC family protein [Chromobacterium phragmitis]|uniref:VOC family protein n=1 Tax=Chromobacterium phragmitis TaxID=2202141 RepID=UPI003877AAC1
MHITGLHHVAIIASDYARSRDFYCRVLNLEVIAENWREERQSWKLDLALPGGGQIELFSFACQRQVAQAAGFRPGAAAMRAHLRGLGVETEALRVDEYTGARFFFCADPDGLPIEFYQPA